MTQKQQRYTLPGEPAKVGATLKLPDTQKKAYRVRSRFKRTMNVHYSWEAAISDVTTGTSRMDHTTPIRYDAEFRHGDKRIVYVTVYQYIVGPTIRTTANAHEWIPTRSTRFDIGTIEIFGQDLTATELMMLAKDNPSGNEVRRQKLREVLHIPGFVIESMQHGRKKPAVCLDPPSGEPTISSQGHRYNKRASGPWLDVPFNEADGFAINYRIIFTGPKETTVWGEVKVVYRPLSATELLLKNPIKRRATRNSGRVALPPDLNFRLPQHPGTKRVYHIYNYNHTSLLSLDWTTSYDPVPSWEEAVERTDVNNEASSAKITNWDSDSAVANSWVEVDLLDKNTDELGTIMIERVPLTATELLMGKENPKRIARPNGLLQTIKHYTAGLPQSPEQDMLVPCNNLHRRVYIWHRTGAGTNTPGYDAASWLEAVRRIGIQSRRAKLRIILPRMPHSMKLDLNCLPQMALLLARHAEDPHSKIPVHAAVAVYRIFDAYDVELGTILITDMPKSATELMLMNNPKAGSHHRSSRKSSWRSLPEPPEISQWLGTQAAKKLQYSVGRSSPQASWEDAVRNLVEPYSYVPMLAVKADWSDDWLEYDLYGENGRLLGTIFVRAIPLTATELLTLKENPRRAAQPNGLRRA